MAEEGEETKAEGGGEPSKAAEENAGEAKVAAGVGVFTPISLNIWPPTQRTREAVIQRLVQTLSTESVLSKRYGVLSASDASDAARRIEEEGFATASASIAGGSAASVDEGIAILEIYSKEISKRMLETVKEKASSASGSAPAASSPPSDGAEAVETAPPTAASGESSNFSPA
ncbi:MFP1 attachment factor 1 [Cocos nucifera]|uniref:MFP1 attachment factor 1 n=1 Tax=Cocos nucifera TaxID=13894 RepID=A0A8K0I7N0_COCNU|nr:MFP1 attachment factor 1 [Cocos nucifera]